MQCFVPVFVDVEGNAHVMVNAEDDLDGPLIITAFKTREEARDTMPKDTPIGGEVQFLAFEDIEHSVNYFLDRGMVFDGIRCGSMMLASPEAEAMLLAEGMITPLMTLQATPEG